jgi:3D (Asp-Asp-Asp) domain-containing protein
MSANISAIITILLALYAGINSETAVVVAEPAPPPEPVWQTFEATEEQETWRTFTATAYVADCDGCSGLTFTEIDVRHTQVDANGRRIVAVDPKVIALGTALEVRIGSETFEAVAEDIGGSIKGARIDVLMETEKEALTFGRQDVEVRIINTKLTEE